MVSATPGRHTSKARTLYDGLAAARAAVASPIPEPISTTSGAEGSSKKLRTSKSGSSTDSSGTHQLSRCRSQAPACRSVSRPPRRA